jgi:UDP-N-acetylmuramoylalanine--D-glutamate ligase
MSLFLTRASSSLYICKSWTNRGIAYESGQHTEDRILEADLVVKSPGIPDKAPLIQKLMQASIPIISEIEFGWRYCKGKVLAITGSNGKTTTTSLLYHILKKEGLDVALGGNIGKSFARLVAEAPAAWYVLEVSSFQLDGCKSLDRTLLFFATSQKTISIDITISSSCISIQN